jgi:glyoxylase-like metal-dependent hydrolase (beta-lactamase superfamily II)
MRHLVRPKLQLEETALHQIQSLGYKQKDIRHIILTHLDFDHAGGVSDFPEASVHVLEPELRAATNPKGFIARSRYRQEQMRSHANWNTYTPQGEGWFGFSSVRNLKGLPPEILFIPLKGHTLGHAGVAIQIKEGWHLHAGDAYFHHQQLAPRYSCPPALTAYQRIMDTDHAARVENLNRLRELQGEQSGKVSIFCSHDASDFHPPTRS